MKTKIFRLSDSINTISEYCAKILKNSGLVAFPTETVYGLGANPFDPPAVERIFSVKGRPRDNPLIFHISSLEWIDRLGFLPEKAIKIVESFFPGPITIVIKSRLDKRFTFGLDTIAVRMPDNLIALKLIERCGFPLVAPSANLSGKPSPTKVEHVIDDFMGKIEAIIDGGETVYGVESTVIDVTEYPVRLLRHGAIPIEEILALNLEIAMPADSELIKRSPGTRYRHYAPKAKVVPILELSQLDSFIDLIKNKRCAFMGLKSPSGYEFFNYQLFSSINDFARSLYAGFRYFDAIGVEVIFVLLPASEGLGRTICDRVLKAAEN